MRDIDWFVLSVWLGIFGLSLSFWYGVIVLVRRILA